MGSNLYKILWEETFPLSYLEINMRVYLDETMENYKKLEY